MSTGIVMCSVCHRELHQDGPVVNGRTTWTHCEDKSPICDGAAVQYVIGSGVETVGRFCGRDE